MMPVRPPYAPPRIFSKGFTLIELMITVAIVAILASIALPSYTQYVVRGRLADGQKILASYALAQEQYFQNNNSYASSGTTCGIPASGSAYASSDFDLSCTASTSSTYTAKLTGKTGGRVAGYEYQIDQTGARKTNSFKGTTTTLLCWATSGASC